MDMPNVRFITSKEALKDELRRIQEYARYISTKCLSYNYDNLQEYNASAKFKESYNVIFIANFPKDFNIVEIDTIAMLIEEGKRCGLRLILNIDRSFFPEDNAYNHSNYTRLYEIYNKAIRLEFTERLQCLHNIREKVIDKLFKTNSFKFEEYSSLEISEVIKTIQHIDTENNCDANDFISLPIGRCGNDIVNFEMGKASGVYHGFIAGQSGTGKSTLLNNIITTIADKYSPNELRLYLLDYKWGVEFQIYKEHPNVELLLLDNENLQLGVEVFKHLEQEIINRAKLFRSLGMTINSIDEYNDKVSEPLPRIIIIVDEVQQLFINYEIRKQINPLVKEIAKQGRAFGVHMLFSSQSYVDCHIDSDALNQMSLRIAFGLANNSECRAILGTDNYAPTKLQPYTAIYNRKNGDKEYNQLVKMDNFNKKHIERILSNKIAQNSSTKFFDKKIIEKTPTEINHNIEQVNSISRKEYASVDYIKEFGF